MNKQTFFDVVTKGLRSGDALVLAYGKKQPGVAEVDSLSAEKAKEYLDQRRHFEAAQRVPATAAWLDQRPKGP